jgi:hypothetical protein
LHGRDEDSVQDSKYKTLKEKPLVRPRCRWEDDTDMETGWESAEDYIEMYGGRM